MDATIRTAFWTDDRLEEQPAEIKLAALWAITNPSRDICGYTRVSNKRFTFETGLEAHWLDALCKALPSSFHAPCKGVVFAVNFLRHQFGKGGKLSPRNKVIPAAIRHAQALPEALRSSFFSAYPELLQSSPSEEETTSENDPPCKGDSPFSDGVIAQHSNSIEEKEGRNTVPTTAHLIAAIPDDFSPTLREAAISWATDKQSRRQAKHRFQSLLAWSACLKRMQTYPDAMVANAVEVAIASGWIGWEHESMGKISAPKQPAPATGGRQYAEVITVPTTTAHAHR